MKKIDLYEKYNIQVPRYTSYPPVPDWQTEGVNSSAWLKQVKQAFQLYNNKNGIALYIHLPYCESLCTYCGCNTRITVNHAVEIPYINALIEEFKMYLSALNGVPKIKEVHLGGGTPTFFSAENLNYLLTEIFALSELMEEAELSFEAHPANTTKEHLQTLYELGFRRLSLGVQDFDEKIQKAINRKQSFQDVKTVIDEARAIGYTSVNLDIIYGLPFQTICSVEKTIEQVLQLQPERIAYYSYAHVPWKHPGQRAYGVKDLPSNVGKRNLYEIGKQKLIKAGYVEIGMDHFGLPNDALTVAVENKSLHRNFMGYVTAPSKFLLGLGVSSISDVDFAYAQNVKTVEQYLSAIEKGEFPFFKGHIQSAMDQLVKECIQQIMCNHELSLFQLTDFPKSLLDSIMVKYKEMENEGLLEIRQGLISVTKEGEKFIRNIAQVLDYRAQEAESARYSQSI
jgi:oxygen-independent coproporphyrinogen-3 oxidase